MQAKNFLLQEAIAARFQNLVRNLLTDHQITEIILVVDQYCLKIISNLFKLTKLVSLGIILIQRLQLKRKVIDSMNALYFIEPREEQISQVISDFKQRRQYRKLHLLFPYRIRQANLKMLALQPNIIKYLAKHSIKEFLHNSYFLEQSTFIMKLDYLKYAYSQQDTSKEKTMARKVSSRIAQLFCSIGKFYQTNIYFYKHANGCSRRMAEKIAEEIEEIIAMLYRNKTDIISQQAPDVDIIVVDRSLDPITPLMHDLHFQAMLFDLFNIELDHYEEETKEQPKEKPKNKKIKKKANSDEEQPNITEESMQQIKEPEGYKKEPMPKGLNQLKGTIYDKYRYRLLAELLDQIPQDIIEHKRNIETMEVTAALDMDPTLTKQYYKIHAVVDQVFKVFNAKNLRDILQLEQSLATGVTEDGKQTSSVALLQNVYNIIDTNKIDRLDQLRLALLSFCCISLSQQDFKALRGRLVDHKNALDNLVWLGVKIASTVKRSTKNISSTARKVTLQKVEKNSMFLSRYTSVIGMIMPLIFDALSKDLVIDETIFGRLVVNENPSKNKQKQTKVQGRKNKLRPIQEPPKQRRKIIVFFVGGATLSEIAQLKAINVANYDVMIGADNIVTPKQYIESLSKMRVA